MLPLLYRNVSRSHVCATPTAGPLNSTKHNCSVFPQFCLNTCLIYGFSETEQEQANTEQNQTHTEQEQLTNHQLCFNRLGLALTCLDCPMTKLLAIHCVFV